MSKYAKRGRVKLTYHSSSSEDEEETVKVKPNEKQQEPESTISNDRQENDDQSDNDEASDSEGADDNDSDQESGWADAISKVLQAKVDKKSFILSKAKKDRDIVIRGKNMARPQVIEIVGEDGKITVEKSGVTGSSPAVKTAQQVREETLRLEWENMGRIKPAANNDKEKEIFLNSIATKGVVQLFNAVNQQQQKIKEKLASVGPLEQKRDKALASFTKKEFLDRLKDNEVKASTSKEEDQPLPPEKKATKKRGNKHLPQKDIDREDPKKSKKGWKVLQDDFVPNAKIKDWDKDDGSDQDSN